jgi:hypothetical protein
MSLPQTLDGLGNRQFMRGQCELDIHRRLEGILCASHATHLFCSGFGVEAFHIARGADFERAVDVDEMDLLAEDLPHEGTMVLFGCHEGADDGVTLRGEELGEVRGAAEVLAAVGIAEAEVGTEAGAEIITIKEHDGLAHCLQMITQGPRERRFAGGWQAEEPEHRFHALR